MPVCTFCKHAYEFPRGLTYVLKDGTVKFFCTSKCQKNALMGRDNKKVKWVRKTDLVKDQKAKKAVERQVRMDAKKVEADVKAARKTKKK
ncbi:MAG: large subunit ribosomal protein L24e [Patescibacteria group bacterium]|jgi:large subunit ribosomal protein L24e